MYTISTADGTLSAVSRPPQPFAGLTVAPDGKHLALRSTSTGGPDPRDLFMGTIDERRSPRKGAYNIDRFARLLDWYDRYLGCPPQRTEQPPSPTR